MPLDPSSLLNDFDPAAAMAAASQLRDMASKSPAALLEQLGGQDFIDGIPSNLTSQLTPLLAKAAPADMLAAVNTAAAAMQDAAKLQKLVDSLPAGALGDLAPADLAKLVKDNVPAFLADQAPNLASLAQAAGLPGVPTLPALPRDAAGLVNGLRDAAPGLYQQALAQIPVPPIPRVLPEDVPLPDPQDISQAVSQCAHAAGAATPARVIEQALAAAPPLPPEVTDVVGPPGQFAEEFAGAMAEVVNRIPELPSAVPDIAGMMSLLGAPGAVPVKAATEALQGMAEAYAAMAPDATPSPAALAAAGRQLQQAAEQMPADALAALF